MRDTPTEHVTYGVHVGDSLAGKYRVDRILGEGAMGIIVAATHAAPHRPLWQGARRNPLDVKLK